MWLNVNVKDRPFQTINDGDSLQKVKEADIPKQLGLL